MSDIDEGVLEGYLLLADTSGYTEFLTGTELEHSHVGRPDAPPDRRRRRDVRPRRPSELTPRRLIRAG